MHIIPQLRKLEHKYRDVLVVIGVHSSKFPNERETENIRKALVRYGVEHPVVNDAEFQVWQEWAVRAWPTLMFVDPLGKVIGKHEGEFPYDAFDRVISEMMAEFDAAGIMRRDLLPFQTEALERASRPLAFPGKVEADAATGRLFIADSNHDRVLIAEFDGRVQDQVGSGETGAADGPFESASFWRPQGMALVGDDLYVCDAESHLLRRVDLRRRTVETVAGTGEQSLYRHQGGPALAVPLNSPYDAAYHDGVLYVAMAGFHQIWALDVAAGRIQPYAGDGGEAIVDGALARARLAQPYGIKTDGRVLYFADSETSALRTAGIGPGAEVRTLIGTGLFDFGDRDGPGRVALLQHLQGLALGEGVVYLADTYNNKIKAYDLASASVRTLAGSGATGLVDGPALESAFDEPAGLARVDDVLFIADTNNHAIRRLDLRTLTVTTLAIG